MPIAHARHSGFDTAPPHGVAEASVAFAHDLGSLEALLGMTTAQIAETAGLPRETLQKASRRSGPKAQSRLREMIEILRRVEGWAGGPIQAMAWYRAEPLPAFGGRTAESLVKTGNATAVRDYLDHVASGGYA